MDMVGSKKGAKCKICKKVFSSINNLFRHEKIHTGVKDFMCKYCERKFTDPSSLIQHERIHTGVKPFKCDNCDKAFVKKYDLNKHAITHTKLKPFKCNLCPERYNRKDVLKLHMKKHKNGLINATRTKPKITESFSIEDSSDSSSDSEYSISNNTTKRVTRNQKQIQVISKDNCVLISDSEECINISDNDSITETFVHKNSDAFENLDKENENINLKKIDTTIQKTKKGESFSTNYKELNFNDIFDSEIQTELQDVCNEIQKCIKGSVFN